MKKILFIKFFKWIKKYKLKMTNYIIKITNYLDMALFPQYKKYKIS